MQQLYQASHTILDIGGRTGIIARTSSKSYPIREVSNSSGYEPETCTHKSSMFCGPKC
jgi:hypothetical protein